MTTTREDLLPIYNACKVAFKKKMGFETPSGYVELPKEWTTDFARKLAGEGLIAVTACRHHADRKAGKLDGWRLR